MLIRATVCGNENLSKKKKNLNSRSRRSFFSRVKLCVVTIKHFIQFSKSFTEQSILLANKKSTVRFKTNLINCKLSFCKLKYRNALCAEF